MKASELIQLLQQKCKDDDPELEFYAYRWNDDLEAKGYNEAWFERVSRRKGKIRVFVET